MMIHVYAFKNENINCNLRESSSLHNILNELFSKELLKLYICNIKTNLECLYKN